MFLTILGYAVAALTGAVAARPLAAKVVSLTKTKKDDKVLSEIGKVLDAIPVPVIHSYLNSKGVKVPELKLFKL